MSYRGPTITFPVGLGGFNGSKNQSRMQADELSYTEGVEIDGGVIRKEGGASKYNGTALASGADVLSGINWDATGVTRYDVVFLGNGSVLRDDGNTDFDTTLASSLTVDTTPPPVFVEAGAETAGADPSLFMFSASNQVQVVDGTGTSFSAINDPPADWSSAYPSFGMNHAGRLWGGGNTSDPHRIYYSATDDHQDFATNGGTLAIYPGEGSLLVGGISFNGLLILFKYPLGVYVVDTRDPSPSNWTVRRLTKAVGAVNQHTILQIERDVLYLDHTGNLHRLSATDAFGDVTTSDIGREKELGAFIRENVNLANIRKATSVWYPARSQAWFMMPSEGQTNNDLRIVADFSDPRQQTRFFITRRDTFLSLWTRPDSNNVQKPAAGDGSGFVWNLDTSARSKDGNAYTMQLETASTNFGWADQTLANKVKNGGFLEVVGDVADSFTVNVQVLWDEQITDTMVFDFGQTGAELGSFELGADSLASAGIATIRRRMLGSGRRLRLIVSNEAEEDVRISEVRVAFTVADEESSNAS